MPRCEGRPHDGRCPDNRCDDTVHLSQGDLMLCYACEQFRFPSQPSLPQSGGKTKRGKKDETSSERRTTSKKDEPSATTASINIIINEFLAYVGFYRNRSTTEGLRRIVLSTFLPDDINRAKQVLIDQFGAVLDSCPLVAERRSSSTRPACEAEVDDIIALFSYCDARDVLSKVIFVAANLSILPKFGPEELNVAAVIDRQARMESALSDVSATVQQLSQRSSPVSSSSSCQHDDLRACMTETQAKIDTFMTSVNAQLDRLNTICKASVATNATNVNAQSSAGRPTVQQADRSLNIVVFGIEENTDALVWRQKVIDALTFVNGQAVDITDMYRLGRFTSDKTRPILVKLKVCWDRRLILSRRSKLRNYAECGIFIEADEPLETRRRNTLDRLKSRAEREGKNINVVDGVLFVDGSPSFSLSEGFKVNVASVVNNANNNNGQSL